MSNFYICYEFRKLVYYTPPMVDKLLTSFISGVRIIFGQVFPRVLHHFFITHIHTPFLPTFYNKIISQLFTYGNTFLDFFKFVHLNLHLIIVKGERSSFILTLDNGSSIYNIFAIKPRFYCYYPYK